MKSSSAVHLFLLGKDYHLGDLLWLTAVLQEYRRQRSPAALMVGLPDREISRILEHNPLIDELLYGEPHALLATARARCAGGFVLQDLRPVALARAMLRDWRYRLPWRYYHDLWFQERGQWLATFLHLGRLQSFRPLLELSDDDFATARTLSAPYVALAPHIGSYRVPPLRWWWKRLKAWPEVNWASLASRLRALGHEPLTLGSDGQTAIPGTRPLLGLPIRQAAGVIARAQALVSGESGLWFVAAACGTPFAIVPWWLPCTFDWAAPMQTPHRLFRRDAATVAEVVRGVEELLGRDRVRIER